MPLDRVSQPAPSGAGLQAAWHFLDRSVGGARASLADPAVTNLDQVHDSAVVTVARAGDKRGHQADAAVTAVPGAKLLIRTADCAPVLLLGEDAGRPVAVGVAHAGWRGLVAGVLPAAVGALRSLGAVDVRAMLFPCIEGPCYEFGLSDLDAVAGALGDGVRGLSGAGKPALDMVAAVRSSLNNAGVTNLDLSTWRCTACDHESLYSYRARQDSGRLGLLAWLEES